MKRFHKICMENPLKNITKVVESYIYRIIYIAQNDSRACHFFRNTFLEKRVCFWNDSFV